MNPVDPDTQLPILRVFPRDLTSYAIVVGDAARVQKAAASLDQVKEIGRNREYLTITGSFQGQRLTVCSHGVGAGSANIVFTELIQGGVHTLIRAGTCGALAADIQDGDNLIITGSVREDKATEQLMPLAYPAFADYEVLAALKDAASEEDIDPLHEGLTVTYANFYPSPILPPPYEKYLGYGVKALEMEMGCLFVLARMHGARAGGILTSDGNLVQEPEDDDDFHYDPYREIVSQGIEDMLQISFRALTRLAQADQPA
jgi:uridine phosphorylase